MSSRNLSLSLTPHGHLHLSGDPEAAPLHPDLPPKLTAAFNRGSGHGLLYLGADASSAELSAVFAFWREIGTRYISTLCTQAKPGVPVPPEDELARFVTAAPPMVGGEYLTKSVLASLWQELDTAFTAELAESKLDLQTFLQSRNPAWNLVGRVHFNLAENRKDPDLPFAFLATYTTRLTDQSKPQHLPLGQALNEYAGAAKKQQLLSLLLPVQRAAEKCAWLKQMVEAREIFYPLRWSPPEALQMLRDVPRLESAGVVVRMPAAWRTGRPARPRVTASVGGESPAGIGQDALLDFKMEVTLDGEPLTAAEIQELLKGVDGLAFVRGRWVELDAKTLQETIDRFRDAEQAAAEGGLPFRDAMRMLAGADVALSAGDELDTREWSQVIAGPWLAETLKALRNPERAGTADPGDALKGTLRPYQQVGVEWLHLLTQLGLGACLADDMGLGKTIQVLSLLLVLRQHKLTGPALLVAPASLLANWAAEVERFAPGLRILVAHPSAMPAADLKSLRAETLEGVDLVITTYGSLSRLPWIKQMSWRLAVLDEAQAIKNPNTVQTRAAKALKARARIALTGTPVENRPGDLWSIFDFINPGLLGSAKAFTAFTKKLTKSPQASWQPLRELVRPYILRRLKTDKSVIADLPDKTEVQAFCSLSRRQAALYEQAVNELAHLIEHATGIERKGLVLSFLMRFKQICNHPSQWLGDHSWAEQDSGKWSRLREIADTVAARQEKMLVFTQFREIAEPLARYLETVCGRPGLVLHGGTQVRKRKDLVRRFQEDESVGFFVLSLKAGGSGLNLTAASHVVHFDRWWNPAVENQATDRAFRIGQTRNVLVHKFVCRGTLEEKIDRMIEAKRELSRELLEGGAETMLTEMSDDELMRLVALDLNKAIDG
ncbi:MAG: DEAD/DEAH box helicase [Bryobacterales bacterium]|nr:DEAD/DEAH box helicase [Bryobacterales bacterium]